MVKLAPDLDFDAIRYERLPPASRLAYRKALANSPRRLRFVRTIGEPKFGSKIAIGEVSGGLILAFSFILRVLVLVVAD